MVSMSIREREMTGIFDYEESHIIEADKFQQDVWTDMSKDSKAVEELVKKGEVDCGETFGGLVDDVFQSLFQYKPNPRENVLEPLSGNKLLIDTLQESNEYEELRAESYLDQEMSAIGTLMLAENLREQVANDPELKKTLEDLNSEEDQDGDADGEGEGDGEGEDGDKPSKKQGKKPAKKPTEEQEKTIARAVAKAAKQAGDKLSEAKNAISSYGLDEGELTKTSLDERKQLIDRLLNNPKLKEIADMVGRLDRIISSQKLSRVNHGAEEIVDITLSNDLAHLTPRELVMMDEAPDDFNRRFVNKELITYELEGQEPTGKGPVVILIDKSGSMNGQNDNWATAITFSLMMQAHKENRDIFYAAFDTRILFSKKYAKGKYTFEELMEVVEIDTAGGTRFEEPLKFAMEACKEDPDLKLADIVFVTDGDASIDQRWLNEVNEQKKSQDINIFTILIEGPYDSCVADEHKLKPISNEIFTIDKIIDNENSTSMVSALVGSTQI
jgi:uncharacterized protein with von Willebrand factor type A (vWA) domain